MESLKTRLWWWWWGRGESQTRPLVLLVDHNVEVVEVEGTVCANAVKGKGQV